MLQNFGSILSILFLTYSLQFGRIRNCLAECTVHSLSPCCGLLTALMLWNSDARWCNTTQFFHKNSVILHACLHGRRKDLFRGALVEFSKSCCMGGQKWWNLFLPLKTMKTALLPTILKFLPPFRHPCLCVGKSSCHTIKTCSNFKRFNTIPNSKISLNFTRKMKCFTDQFQLCFCFCIGKSKHLFLHWQHNWHPYRPLASCQVCFVLSLHSGI